MRSFLELIKDKFFEILVAIVLFAIIGLVIIGETYIYRTNEVVTEKECYTFWKENNYILDECSKYEEKFK